MQLKKQPVAVFDSGVGGISVLQVLNKELPHEDFLFFGDSLNAPYGTKSVEMVRTLTDENISRLIAQGAKAVVIACNTATSAAEKQLRKKFGQVPIIGMEPALKPAVMETKGGRVLVLATPVTLKLDKFQVLMEHYQNQAEVLIHPCPGLADLIEEGDPESPAIQKLLEEQLSEYQKHPVDAVVLGCTHYPFVKKQIRKILGEEVKFFDGALGTARQLQRRLEEMDLVNPGTTAGTITFQSSKPGREEIELYQKLYRE